MKTTTTLALIGEGNPQIVQVDSYLAVECKGADLWAFRAAYDALPLAVECGGIRYFKSAYNSFRQQAYYHAN